MHDAFRRISTEASASPFRSSGQHYLRGKAEDLKGLELRIATCGGGIAVTVTVPIYYMFASRC